LTNATTGRAMMAAALTTAGGFAVLNLSSLLPLRLFGQAFVIAILLALASSIILLPCLMSLFGLLPEEESAV
jgi:predicted RND superfamily exporter protein